MALWEAIAGHTRARDPRIRQAFHQVPRAAFVEGNPAADSNVGIPIKRRDGEVLSSSTTPSLVADMLEFLHVPEGSRVLEIGSGSGFNAALLSCLAGRRGRVVSLDLEPDVVEWARRACRLVDLPRQPEFLCRSGSVGAAEGAPYHRIVATAAVSFLPSAWVEQLAPEGWILFPWKFRGLDFLVRLSKPELRGTILMPCSFPSLRGDLYVPHHDWSAVEEVGPLFHRARREDRLEFPPGTPWPHLDFAFFAALRSPAFRLWMGRAPRPGGGWSALSLYWGRDSYSLWTRDRAYHTGAQSRAAFRFRFEEWLEAGSPACQDWEVRVILDPRAAAPPGARLVFLPEAQRWAIRRRRKPAEPGDCPAQASAWG